MDWDFLVVFLDGLIFYGILYSLPFVAIELLKQYNIRKLCRYQGRKGKPGAACVICAYHHKCARAGQSREYKQYAYWRRVCPEQAKAIFDEVWEQAKAGAKEAK